MVFTQGPGVTFGISPKLKLMMKIIREREKKNASQAVTKAVSFVKETAKDKDQQLESNNSGPLFRRASSTSRSHEQAGNHADLGTFTQ